MKTEEQVKEYLDALHKDTLQMYSEGVMSMERQKGLANIVGTLLWVTDQGSGGVDYYIEDVRARFEEHFGGGVEGKYGVVFSTLKKFHKGEPVFLIRATDPLAYKLVQEYAERSVAAGCLESHVAAAYDHARRIREWQEKTPALVKKMAD